MLYSDVYTADQILGLIYIKALRLIKHQDGQETSANGTGAEKTCAGQRGANGTARYCNRIFRTFQR